MKSLCEPEITKKGFPHQRFEIFEGFQPEPALRIEKPLFYRRILP